MKWFKHQTDASDDIFIEELEELFGWEGYGRWWKLLEIIGKRMDETDDCSATHSWVKWQTLLKGKRNKLETFLVHCQVKGRIKLEQTGNILKIICPKLLEIRDEYSKKSGHTPDKSQDKLPAKNQDLRNQDLDIKDLDLLKKGTDFDVDKFLSDIDRQCAKAEAPGWDLHALVVTFNAYVKRNEVPRYPEKAFLQWVISFTKGKSP